MKKNVCERASICVHLCVGVGLGGWWWGGGGGGREVIQTKDKMNSVP